jgi:site-specific DNA-methyltransferase (adenine-specific)
MAERRRTSTSNFGVGRRESHDASGFYDRFRPPDLSDDRSVLPPKPVRKAFVCGDSRQMDTVRDGSVALVVTSPPYFAGKAYEEELAREGVPGSYLEYLELLGDVFAECTRKLEPGGRIAVNVANLGRKPYRSLSADVIRILQDDLGLLLRGELIWQKSEGASGSCAWGSFRSATNPVLRDVTERVIVASKGRFDRARTVKERQAEGLPYESTLMTEDFLALTLDVWEIPPESARRVGHPAPFPVELPEQLIRLYTFADDLVLDPFMGSGSALVAAARLGRRYVGYDFDPSYVEIARRRVGEARVAVRPSVSGTEQPEAGTAKGGTAKASAAKASTAKASAAKASTTKAGAAKAGAAKAGARRVTSAALSDDEFAERAAREGKAAQKLAEDVLVDAGFEITDREHRVPRTGVTVSLVARDALGEPWYFDVPGSFTSHRPGLLRTDAVWRSLGRANAIRGRAVDSARVVFLTTHLPRRPGEGDTALRAAGPDAFFDAVEMLGAEGRERLARYAKGDQPVPLPGFWAPADLARRSR